MPFSPQLRLPVGSDSQFVTWQGSAPAQCAGSRSGILRNDPVLNLFTILLQKEMKEDLFGALLFGPRAHGNLSRDCRYDVAVFLHNVDDRAAAMDRLRIVSDEMLNAFDAEFNALAFDASEWEQDTALVSALKENGVLFFGLPPSIRICEPDTKDDEYDAAPGAWCVCVRASSCSPDSYPTELCVADTKTSRVRSWAIDPPEDWQIDDIIETEPFEEWPDQEVFAPEQVVKEMSQLMGRSAKLLSANKEIDQRLMGLLLRYGDTRARYFPVGNYNEFVWNLARNSSPYPETALYQAELKAHELDHSDSLYTQALVNAEVIRVLSKGDWK